MWIFKLFVEHFQKPTIQLKVVLVVYNLYQLLMYIEN